MDDQQDVGPPPEALLIRRHRMAAGLTVANAAKRTAGNVSYRRWSQIEQGFITRAGKDVPTAASDQALAHMAAVVNVAPQDLERVGKGEAAEVLRVILADQASSDAADSRGSADPRLEEMRHDRKIVRQLADYFENESVPTEEKKEMAERFFKLLPWFLTGQAPPRELLDQPKPDDKHEDGSSRSA